MKKRNLEVNNDKIAKNYIKNIGYYKLTKWYGKCFLKRDLDGNYIEDFEDGTSIEDLYNLFLFDEKLKVVFFEAIISYEIRFKEVLNYTMSNAFGADINSCLKNNNYFNAKYNTVKEGILGDIEKQKVKRNPCICEHINAYNYSLMDWCKFVNVREDM